MGLLRSGSGDRAARGSLARRMALLGLPAALALAVVALMNAGGTASADDPVRLNGEWAPFGRCPVDDPVMLAVGGSDETSYCVATTSPGGSIKLGNTTAATGESAVQLGLAGTTTSTTAPFTVVSPAGGAITGAPAEVPGGLLGLMCPSLNPVVASVCASITNNSLNAVSATVQQAGPASDFNLFAGLAVGVPIVTLPIKIKLDNPLLGANCYIGSEADPIVLRPANLSTGPVELAIFDTDGTPDFSGPLQALKTAGVSQGDSTFAVPGATGCGVAGLLSSAINAKEGLPSPAGNNYLVLNDVSSALARFYPPLSAPDAGQQFADAWHSAVCSGACPSGPAATATPDAVPTATPGPECALVRADVDQDGVVSILDLSQVAQQFGLAIPPADPLLNQDADNTISILDLSAQAEVFGQHVTACL